MKSILPWARKTVTRVVQAWLPFWIRQHVALSLADDAPRSAALLALAAEVEALHCRLLRHSPRRHLELISMLRGALTAGVLDVQEGRRLLELARTRFQAVTQTHNQLLYMAGAVFGALAGVIGVWKVLSAAGTPVPAWAREQADAATIASLCLYGLAGSLTSIFTRLSQLQLGEIDSPTTVFTTGFVQPFIALGFVSVVYIILRYELLGLAFKVPPDGKMAPIWVAAFLCGFSERFAPSILDSSGKLFVNRSAAKPPEGPGN
ncbi:hypothetical protein GJ699_06120 [Duganella sp. FT80W]|uniref:Uncharacterized protein n=1 Tax=Duganella guangzhouensis TaxID=2666084 RepID=A0A6I2KYN1_9BURK|nr:hypothetical protein [Duganella guangzhouensis]MRW89554.1 hypothetical protein [Duganella guangzhouensis]